LVSEEYLGARKLEAVRRIELDPDQELWVGKKLVAERELAPPDSELFARFLGETTRAESRSDRPIHGPQDNVLSPDDPIERLNLASFERMETGFPKIPGSD
jgi:hypothetical protein